MMKNSIYIFDFDGTIADTHHALVKIFNQLAVEFNFNLIKPDEIESLKNKTTLEIIHHLNIPTLKLPSLISRGKKEFHNNMEKIKPFEGLKELLINASQSDFKIGILSSNSFENINKFLKHHKIDVFDFVHTTSMIWSKNTSLKRLMNKYGFLKEEIIYIGDEIRDIVAAQKLGIKIAAVTWGYNSSTALQKYNPDYLIHTPEDLFNLLLRK